MKIKKICFWYNVGQEVGIKQCDLVEIENVDECSVIENVHGAWVKNIWETYNESGVYSIIKNSTYSSNVDLVATWKKAT